MRDGSHATALYINGRYVTQRTSGVQRYAQEFVYCLDRLITTGRVVPMRKIVLAVPTGNFILPEVKNILIVQAGYLRGHAWEQLELPNIARNALLFNPCGVAPLFHPLQVTTLHDASVFMAADGYSWRFKTWHRFLIRRAARSARLILTVSEHAKKELTACCRISGSRIRVVYESGCHILREQPDMSILRQHGLLDGMPYVLCVGSQQPNKNFGVVAKAAALLPNQSVRVVAVGGSNSNVFRGDAALDKTVIRTGYVTDAQLRALYQGALCFIFPSLYEGFGIPPIEAMCCDCPVIASNATAIPEVCGDAALYFDPHNASELAECIRRIQANPGLRADLQRSGRARCAYFNFDTAVLQAWKHLSEAQGAL